MIVNLVFISLKHVIENRAYTDKKFYLLPACQISNNIANRHVLNGSTSFLFLFHT